MGPESRGYIGQSTRLSCLGVTRLLEQKLVLLTLSSHLEVLDKPALRSMREKNEASCDVTSTLFDKFNSCLYNEVAVLKANAFRDCYWKAICSTSSILSFYRCLSSPAVDTQSSCEQHSESVNIRSSAIRRKRRNHGQNRKSRPKLALMLH